MDRNIDFLTHNRQAWNSLSQKGNRWTVPFGDDAVSKARSGNLELVLTPCRHVPIHWYPSKGSRILALASGGGQQVPLLAAAGYHVVSFDNSEMQLEADKNTCTKFGLDVECVHGDMNDLSALGDSSFDAVFNPCSTGFVPNVAQVYGQVGRVLKPGGIFMTGFVKPIYYLFDIFKAEKGDFRLKYSQPYSDLESLDDVELKHFLDANEPLVYGHSLTAHIKGQLDAGMFLVDMFEDIWGEGNPVDRYFPAFMATCSRKSTSNSIGSFHR
ncbi:MAG: class I SAM-dependent methyltransferase [Bacteroidota bacterium]